MTTLLSDALNFLSAQSFVGLLGLFWFTVVFEIQRHGLAFVSASIWRLRLLMSPDRRRRRVPGRVTAIIIGHSEAGKIEKCVASLREQSRPPDEIIVVSDGSDDNMPDVLARLRREGLIQRAHCTDLRGGKSAGMNLAERWASGEFVVNVDCDCSFDRHALRNLLEPMADPTVGAVSGNILVRNPNSSLTATFQAIEYIISISLGKQAAQLIGQVVCVSGAFGAFRTGALKDVNGVDVGGGEDLDLTIKLRKRGWQIVFADDAVCYTDVPETLRQLAGQRLRWERDAIRIRYRKHADLMNPFSANFRLSELFHEVEFILFQIVGAAVLPLYLLWLLLSFGQLGVVIFIAAQLGLVVLDMAIFALAALATPKASSLRLILYVPGYSLFNGMYMRFIRLWAYLQEWVLNASAEDNYVPAKVRVQRKW